MPDEDANAHPPQPAVPATLTPAQRRWINWRLKHGPAMERQERGEYLMKLVDRITNGRGTQ
jgi:hypothetical protein